MQSRVILISDDDNFFEYITPKLSLRRGDELFRFHYDEITDKIHCFIGSVIIINSEAREELSLEVLDVLEKASVIVFSYNENSDLKKEVFKRGGCFYITLMTSDEEFSAILTSAYQTSSLINQNKNYRELLVKNNLLTPNNEVYVDYTSILDNELNKIKQTSAQAVLLAIAPNEKTKFLLQSNQIETIILNNIRTNDVLMNYAPNKYFLLLYDTDLKYAQKIWEAISAQIPENIYAGFTNVTTTIREQVVNEALNRLHEAIKKDKYNDDFDKIKPIEISNFKLYRQEINKKIENIVEPVFYHVVQKYSSKLYGITLNYEVNSRSNILKIKSRISCGEFRITTPGFSQINIDITYQSLNSNLKPNNFPASKRISFEPQELDAGVLEDLLEQYIQEFKEDSTVGNG